MEVDGKRSLTKSVRNNSDILLCQKCQCDGTDICSYGYCKTCDMHLCQACLNFHQSFQQTTRHMITYSDNISNNKTDDDCCTSMCDKHETEVVKFYCQRHDYVGCTKCRNLTHRHCWIQPIADVSRNFGTSRELETVKQDTKTLMTDIKSFKQNIVSSLNTAQKNKENMIEEIKAFHADLKQYLETAEADILQRVEQVHRTDVKLHTTLFNDCDTMETEINKYQEKINQSSTKEDDLFVAVKLAKKKLSYFQDSAAVVVSKAKLNTYEFVPSPDIMAFKQNRSPLGTLDIHYNESREDSLETDFVDKINIKAETEDNCAITGMVMISGEEILLADNSNSSLKILDIYDCKITSMCKIAAEPFSVTNINPGTAAATIPGEGKILFMNTKNGLTHDSTLNVRKNCRGLDYSNGLLAMIFCSPPTVQLLDLNGKILQEIQDSRILRHPGSVAFTNDNTAMYVSDFAKNTVFKLEVNDNLTVLKTYTDLNRPSGLAVTKNNEVMVCCTGDNECISVINCPENGVRYLSTKHVQKPVSIAISEGQNYICICESKGAVDSNYIKVYHLKKKKK